MTYPRTPLRYAADVDPWKSEIAARPDDLEVGFIPMDAVGHGDPLTADETRRLVDVRDGYTYLRDGDCTFAKISPSFQNRKGGRALDLPNGIAFATTELTVIRPSEGMDGRFLQYVLSSDDFIQKGAATLHGVAGQQRVSTRFVSDYGVPSPPLEVQRRVADMLDAETARIDTLINKNQQVIKATRVRRDEMVARAVTEGVEGRPTRPVDLGWAESISQDWDTAGYQYIARIGTGHTPSRSNDEYWENTHHPWITTGDVKSLRDGYTVELEDTAHHISDLGLRNSSATIHPASTVFLSRTASVGFSGVMGQDMATSQDFVTWTCEEARLVPRYLLFVLRAMKARGLFDRMMFGSTHNTIYFDPLRQLSGPLPPRDEQERIVEHVLDRLPKHQMLEEKAARQIDLLETRRRSLITAAVTGQITV